MRRTSTQELRPECRPALEFCFRLLVKAQRGERQLGRVRALRFPLDIPHEL
jgi:hypothetical protein